MGTSLASHRCWSGCGPLLIGVALLISSPSSALAEWTYAPLLPPGCESAWAHAVNEDAMVAGEAQCQGIGYAFIYDAGAYTLMLPDGFDSAGAYGINDAGDIVGWGYKRATRTPFVRWKATGTVTELAVPGFASAEALGIDNAGVVVGRGTLDGQAAGAFTGFTYSISGGFTILATDAVVPSIEPLAVNGPGTVVGTGLHAVDLPEGDVTYLERAFTFASGVMSVLLPPNWVTAHGLGISSTGDVVGYGTDAAGLLERSYVHTQNGYQLLPSPSGWTHVRAAAINAAGLVVGQRCDDECAHWAPFVYQAGKYSEVGPAGWTAVSAEAINDHGAIVGSGHDGSSTKGFLATPITTVSVTVTTVPAALTIDVDGTSYTSPHTFTWEVGSTHTLSAPSPQGSGGTRRVFHAWSDTGAQTHDITVPADPEKLIATFRTQHRLALAASPSGGGSISATPSSPDGFYDKGTAIQVTALPADEYAFASWSGKLVGTTNPRTLTLNAPASVTANFVAKVAVIVSTDPPGRRFLVDGVTYTATQTFSWVPGSNHVLLAPVRQVSGNTRYVFANWSDGGASRHEFATPDSATTVAATYTTQYRLTTAVSPAMAGSISASPAAPDGFYDKGTRVQLIATPATRYVFTKWSGAIQGTANPKSVTMNGARPVTANFAKSDFEIDSASGGLTRTVKPGRSAVYRLDVTPRNGFTGPVSVACSALPPGATCFFDPIVVPVDGSKPVALKVTVRTTRPAGNDPGTPTGTYGLMLTGKSHELTHALTLTLVVQ